MLAYDVRSALSSCRREDERAGEVRKDLSEGERLNALSNEVRAR